MLVVGAGITGALIAQHLASLGNDVCVIDRERPGLGSTAASTAMLLWEIDKKLTTLTMIYGFEHASRVYRQSLAAVAGLQDLVRTHRIPCSFRSRYSLYLAAGDHGARDLLAEHELRQRAGAADADPLCLARSLMVAAIAEGAAFFDADAAHYETAGQTVAVTTEDGHAIEADWVVLATGYVMPDFVRSPLHSISSSWALATPPQSKRKLWRDGVLIWEAATDYLYARTTADHRIIIGGEDD